MMRMDGFDRTSVGADYTDAFDYSVEVRAFMIVHESLCREGG